MKKNPVLCALLVGVVFWLSGPTLAQSSQPNVLFIAVDDLNDWIGVLGGYPGVKTPNLDRLAQRGMLFTRAYTAAPACNPSRVALLTGIRPSTSGVYHNDQAWRPVLPEAVTLPQLFMAHGYQVVGAGKIFHGRYPDDPSWHQYLPRGPDPQPDEKASQDPQNRAGGIIWGALDVPDEEMDDYRMVSWVIDYLKKKSRPGADQRPFFAACGIFRPHMPWQVPRKYYEMYPLEEIRLPEVPEDDLADVPAAGLRMARPERDHAAILKTGNWQRAVQAYLASITFADAQVGRLLDTLDQSPFRDNTILVLWSDHGWHLGEKQHWRKFALWEEATRSVLMFVVPGMTQAGSVCHRTVDFLNIYPTLADLCGLPRGDHLEGVSMRVLLENPKSGWGHPALTTHGRNNHAVRSERWRYIRYADGSEELYDHQSDPMEWKNLASNPQYARTKSDHAAWLPRKNALDAPRGR